MRGDKAAVLPDVAHSVTQEPRKPLPHNDPLTCTRSDVGVAVAGDASRSPSGEGCALPALSVGKRHEKWHRECRRCGRPRAILCAKFGRPCKRPYKQPRPRTRRVDSLVMRRNRTYWAKRYAEMVAS